MPAVRRCVLQKPLGGSSAPSVFPTSRRLKWTEAASVCVCVCVEGYWGRGAPATDGCVWEDSNRLPQKLDYVLS